MSNFIKIHRKIMLWEWYQDSRMVHIFLHLLVNAAWKDKRYQGKEVKRGQVITSVENISAATGLSTRQIRTGLDRLENSGELTRRTTNQNTVITICNYDSYQCEDTRERQATGQTSDKRATNERQTTVQNHMESQQIEDTKKVKKVKKEKTIAPSPAKAEPEPVIKIPTNRFETIGEEVSVCQQSVDMWKDTFPGIDVVHELKKARSWSVNNKARRKTKAGVMKFLNGWMERAQNSSKGNGQATGGERIRCEDCIGFNIPTAKCPKNNPETCEFFSRR